MAHHKSATKRVRQIKKRTEINRARASRVRTFVKKVETAIASGDRTAAVAAFAVAQPELMRGVDKRVVHRNTAARKLSRLAARIKGMAT
jgi:small subunit ribosomal protein S20